MLVDPNVLFPVVGAVLSGIFVRFVLDTLRAGVGGGGGLIDGGFGGATVGRPEIIYF